MDTQRKQYTMWYKTNIESISFSNASVNYALVANVGFRGNEICISYNENYLEFEEIDTVPNGDWVYLDGVRQDSVVKFLSRKIGKEVIRKRHSVFGQNRKKPVLEGVYRVKEIGKFYPRFYFNVNVESV